MKLWIKVEEGRIAEIRFRSFGCPGAIATSSMATELAKGKSVSQAMKITQQDVLDALGGLPEDSVHCALLATNTLKEAVKDYLVSKKEPWKRAYKSR